MEPNSVRLIKVIFSEVPIPAEMHLRPYNAVSDSETVDRIVEDLIEDTSGGTVFSNEALTKHSSRIMTPANTSKGVIEIDENGWDTQRLAVEMLFEVTGITGQSSMETISGYTDFYGVNPATGSLAGDMTVYVNSHRVARANGVINSQVIRPVNYTSNAGKLEVAACNVRPVDVAEYGIIQEHGMGGGNTGRSVITSMSHTSDRLTSSRRSNSVSSSYLSRLLGAHNTARVSNTDSENNYNPGLGNVAGKFSSIVARSSAVLENSYTTSTTFRAMVDRCSYEASTGFTIDDIANVWPNIYNDDTTILNELDEASPTNIQDEVDSWGGSNSQSAIAHSVMQTMRSIMADYSLSRVDCTLTNRDSFDGAPILKIMHSSASGQVNAREAEMRLNRFKACSENLCHLQIVNRGVSDYELSASINAYGDMFIDVAINGGEMYSYSAPAYCDSLYSPVVTTSSFEVEAVANTLNGLVYDIFDKGVGETRYTESFDDVWNTEPQEQYNNSNDLADLIGG